MGGDDMKIGRTYVLNKGTLVLEGVTLAQVVELVVKVLVDLASSSVLDEKTTEDTKAAHPDGLAVHNSSAFDLVLIFHLANSSFLSLDLVVSERCPLSLLLFFFLFQGARIVIPGHTSILGTLSLTETTVTADTASGSQLTGAGARVHGNGLADDEAIRDELADGLTRVGVGDLAGLVRVEPDLALTAANNGGCEALLSTEVDPVDECCQPFVRWMTFAVRRSGSCNTSFKSTGTASWVSNIAVRSPDSWMELTS